MEMSSGRWALLCIIVIGIGLATYRLTTPSNGIKQVSTEPDSYSMPRVNPVVPDKKAPETTIPIIETTTTTEAPFQPPEPEIIQDPNHGFEAVNLDDKKKKDKAGKKDGKDEKGKDKKDDRKDKDKTKKEKEAKDKAAKEKAAKDNKVKKEAAKETANKETAKGIAADLKNTQVSAPVDQVINQGGAPVVPVTIGKGDDDPAANRKKTLADVKAFVLANLNAKGSTYLYQSIQDKSITAAEYYQFLDELVSSKAKPKQQFVMTILTNDTNYKAFEICVTKEWIEELQSAQKSLQDGFIQSAKLPAIKKALKTDNPKVLKEATRVLRRAVLENRSLVNSDGRVRSSSGGGTVVALQATYFETFLADLDQVAKNTDQAIALEAQDVADKIRQWLRGS